MGEEVQLDWTDARITTNKLAHSTTDTTLVCKAASSPIAHSWPLWMSTEGPCTFRTKKVPNRRHNLWLWWDILRH